MSYQQAFDFVVTPARNREDWPSPNAFRYPKSIFKWSDISTGVFKILDKFELGESQYGKDIIVKLEHFNGPIIFVWAPRRLIFALKHDEDAKFVQNLGIKYNLNGYQYFDFKLC